MPFRIAMLALALAAAGAASAQTGAGDPRTADADLDRTVVEADVIEGVSDLEVTARGNAEINRDDLSIFGDLLRYNRELGRAEGDGGVRLRRGSDRFFGPRLYYNTLRRHRRVRDPGVSPAGRPHRTRQRRAPGIPRARPLPHDQRDVHDLPARSGRLAAGGEGARSRLRGGGRRSGNAAAALLRHHDPGLAVGDVSARRPAAQRDPDALLRADQHARLRVRPAVLLEHRPRVRRDLHAGVHGEARRPAEDPGPLPRPQLRRRGQVRVSARRQGIRRFARRRVACSTHTDSRAARRW